MIKNILATNTIQGIAFSRRNFTKTFMTDNFDECILILLKTVKAMAGVDILDTFNYNKLISFY